jgi:hypothetical protein
MTPRSATKRLNLTGNRSYSIYSCGAQRAVHAQIVLQCDKLQYLRNQSNLSKKPAVLCLGQARTRYADFALCCIMRIASSVV